MKRFNDGKPKEWHQEAWADHFDLRSGKSIRHSECDYLFRLFELYSNIQVQADTIYYYRTSIITLTEGLLFVSYPPAVQLPNHTGSFLGSGIATMGLVLSILWLFFEQRNAAYFAGRGTILTELELELLSRSKKDGVLFRSFWTDVPKWVKTNAAWYQRVSAPLILRTLIPLLFILTWLFTLGLTQLMSHDAVPGKTDATNSQPQSGIVLPAPASSSSPPSTKGAGSASPKIGDIPKQKPRQAQLGGIKSSPSRQTVK